MSAPAAPQPLQPCTLGQLGLYFLRLGTVGFGGPIALAGRMQRELVEERRWLAPGDYVEGLALAQLAPGPLAAQLAIYLGWVRGRVLGATVAGLAFVAPSFLMVCALAAAYLRAQGLGWIQGVFYGVGAAVIAVIARSVFKLGKLTLSRDPVLWGIGAVSAATTAWTEREVLWLFLASGALVMAQRTRPGVGAPPAVLLPPALEWAGRGLHGLADGALLARLFVFFAESGAVVFGSGLAIVPFLHGGVVDDAHWLDERQFLDAVAVAMVTPGPVVITVAFIGYLVAGPLGALLAALGVFAPCYLVVVLLAPHYRRWARNPRIKAFVVGVTAAATGAIAGAAVVLARRAVVDLPTALVALVTLALLVKTKIPEPLLMLGAGAVGLALHAP